MGKPWLYPIAFLAGFSVLPANAATILTGDARLMQGNPVFGDVLVTGETTGGTIRIDAGDTLTLNRSPSPNFTSEAPTGVNIGRRTGAVNTFELDDATLIIDADGAAAFFLIARDGADGTATLTNGALLRLVDATAATGTSRTSGEGISVGRSGSGTGTLSVIASTIEIDSASGANFQVGREGATGNVLFDNATVTLIDRDPTPAAQSSAVILLGQDVGSSGSMHISNGSSVSLSSDTGLSAVIVGNAFNATADLLIDGGSVVDLATFGPPGSFGSDFSVGNRGVGTATVTGGAKVIFSTPDGDVFVGVPSDSRPFAGQGTLIIDGAGSEIAATDTVGIGRTDWNPSTYTSGGGLVQVVNGGLLSTRDGMHIGEDGVLHTDAEVRIGTDAVDMPNSANVLAQRYMIVSDGGVVKTPNLNLDAGGFLGGSGGTLDGNLTLNGGTLSPGFSPGEMTITGDLTYLDGVIDLEIGGVNPGEFDVINILGDFLLPTVQISPPPIRISFIDDFLPSLGDRFDLFNVGGSIFGEISARFLDSDGNELTGFQFSLFDEMSGAGTFGFSVTSVPSPVIPLPASLWLMLGALGTIGAASRLRRRA